MESEESKLLLLDYRISKLRELLNDATLTPDKAEVRLMLSEYLDELIVKYMKLRYCKDYDDLIQ